MKTYFLDGTSYIYRAYYALPKLTNSKNFPTNVIYGFTRMCLSLIRKERIEYFALCFDSKAPSFRHREFPEYKSQRPPMPEDLGCQLPKVNEVVEAFRVASFSVEGFEADDILATLAGKAGEKFDKIYLVTSDKDILQLVSDRVNVLNPFDKTGIYTSQKVKDIIGVEPARIPDFLALTGDPVDNIPGVTGIGKKSACTLLTEFDTLEDIIKNRDKIGNDRWRRSVEEEYDLALRNKRLITLRKDVPLEVDWEACRLDNIDYPRLRAIFRELEFKKFLPELEPSLFSL